jgi:hypothetical protein
MLPSDDRPETAARMEAWKRNQRKLQEPRFVLPSFKSVLKVFWAMFVFGCVIWWFIALFG